MTEQINKLEPRKTFIVKKTLLNPDMTIVFEKGEKGLCTSYLSAAQNEEYGLPFDNGYFAIMMEDYKTTGRWLIYTPFDEHRWEEFFEVCEHTSITKVMLDELSKTFDEGKPLKAEFTKTKD